MTRGKQICPRDQTLSVKLSVGPHSPWKALQLPVQTKNAEVAWHHHWEQNLKHSPQQYTKIMRILFCSSHQWQGSCSSKLTFCRSRNTRSLMAPWSIPGAKVMWGVPVSISDLHPGGTASTCVKWFHPRSKATKEGVPSLPSSLPLRPQRPAWRLPKEVQRWNDFKSEETSRFTELPVRSKLVSFGIQLCFSPAWGGTTFNSTTSASLKFWSSWQHPFQVPSSWPTTLVRDRSTDWISFQLRMVEMSPETLVPDMSKCFNLVLLRKRVMSPEALHEARLNFSKSSNSPKRSSSAPFTWLLWLPKSISVTLQFLLGDMGKSLPSQKCRRVWLNSGN